MPNIFLGVRHTLVNKEFHTGAYILVGEIVKQATTIKYDKVP